MTGRSRRRRWVALVAAAVVVFASGGCGSSGDSGPTTAATGAGGALPPCPLEALDHTTQPVEVVVWHSMQAKQADTLEAIADEYNALQGRVRVRMENQATTDEELLRKFNSAVPSRQLPGLFVANDTMTQEMIDSGVALPAQSCIDADGYDMSPFLTTVRNYYTVGGVMWAASANPGSALVYYNKEHFRRAGLDPERPPRTLAELREDAEKIKAAGVVDRPFVHEVASFKTEFWLTGDHAPIVDNDNGRAAPATAATLVPNQPAEQLFEWFARMNADGLMQPIPVAEGQINQYLAMATQQASMAVESSSSATSVEAFLAGKLDTSSLSGGDRLGNVSGLDIGAGAFPGISEPGRTQMGGPAWYVMSTNPPAVQAAAWDFVKFLNSEPIQTQLLTGASYLPFRASAADTPDAQAFFSGSLAGRWLKIANEQVRAIDPTFPGPLIGPYAQTRDILRDALSDVLFKGTSPTDALDKAQRDVDSALQRYSEGGF